MTLFSVHLFKLNNKKLNSKWSDNAFLIEIISNKLAVLLKKLFLQKKTNQAEQTAILLFPIVK